MEEVGARWLWAHPNSSSLRRAVDAEVCLGFDSEVDTEEVRAFLLLVVDMAVAALLLA
jgi:hypothetical protein